ncbi:hypothetical protein C8P66_101297 [Humitalea rosea]|uniref:DUF2219 family protein n=1 Tax=Humitalea rosea TaxID=990373 RepID=A0A2W7KR75_9PROT|nr:lipid A deacylase LpxR family protein [Humitalea rosea]PZW51080.1 hypothetical protein C8P66_101297 [Humitalea rosea]
MINPPTIRRLAAAAWIFSAGAAAAQTPLITTPTTPPAPDPYGTVSVSIENDTLGGTDRYYTNGVQLMYRSPSADLPSPLAWLDRQLDFLQGPGALRWGASVSHSIYTPGDTNTYTADPRDRPYAGLLLGSVSLTRATADTLSVVELQAGLVGPSALGRQVQNDFHRLIDDAPANGWAYQLHDEPVVDLVLDRKWRRELPGVLGMEMDLIPSMTLALGNLTTFAAAGGMFRIGQGLDADFGPPRVRPSLAGSAFFQPKTDEFGWYVFAGAEGRAVARDLLLEGNTWRDSPGVTARPLVGDMQVGVAFIWHGVRIAYTQVFRTEEFYGQGSRGNGIGREQGLQQFGSLSVSARF